jgi:hypothetical protein
LIGVTAAAALMPRMIPRASSPTSAFTAGSRVSSSNFWSRQLGKCASSRSLRRMGSPTLTCTVPKRSRNTRSDSSRSSQLSFFLGAPDSSEM